MTNIPDLREQAEVFDGNTVFDNVFILDTLDYDFKKSGTIEISNLQVVGVTTFAGDISVDEITVRNVDVTGIATVNTNLYVKGTLWTLETGNTQRVHVSCALTPNPQESS